MQVGNSMIKERFDTSYLDSPEIFLRHRLKYYQDTSPTPVSEVTQRVFPNYFCKSEEGMGLLAQRQSATDAIRRSCPEIIIVTATKNRKSGLAIIHNSLVQQKGNINWSWVIVDNGSKDNSMEFIKLLQDDRVLPVRFIEQTGCAYPVRNFGLDLVHQALYRQMVKTPYVFVLDSDDNFNNPYSLHELAEMRSDFVGNKPGKVLMHGFSVTENSRGVGNVFCGTEPHDFSSSFPNVNALSEVFDKGLNVLSGCFPAECLDWLRYPPEPSFEDNGFNHKLLLRGRALNMTWLAKTFPITTKHLQPDCMSTENNMVGNQLLQAKIGEYSVSGMRATIVGHIKYLTDYFYMENL